jgi:hypothetical protein
MLGFSVLLDLLTATAFHVSVRTLIAFTSSFGGQHARKAA